MNIKALLNNTLHRLILGLVSFMASIGLLILFLNRVDANNPTFFLSASSGCSVTREISGTVGENKTLYICVDGANEGAGLFGGEASVNYDTSLLSATSVSCRNFDSCSNLSSPGQVRLLGVSGAAPDGHPVTGRGVFGSVSFNLKQAGTANLSFTKATVIDATGAVLGRTGISARINISAPAVEPAPSPTPEPTPTPTPLPAPEPTPAPTPSPTPTPTPEPVPAPTPEPTPPPTPEGLARVIASPLSQTGRPGQVIHIISRADYHGDRPDENITSCFTCPTAGNKDAAGLIKYNIKGPATVYGNRVTINSNAKSGQIIQVSATYTDFKSNTTATSGIRTIKVLAPASAEIGGPTDLRAPEDGCDPATGAGCEPTDRPNDFTAGDQGPALDCVDANGTRIPCPPEERPGCVDANGAPIDCPSNPEPGCVDADGKPIDCPRPECDPNRDDCGTKTSPDPGGSIGCVDADGKPIRCPENEPECDPTLENCDTGRGEPECDPIREDCTPSEDPCDPTQEDCGPNLTNCNPASEDCGSGNEGGCDPMREICKPGRESGCDPETENCGEIGNDCDPNKEDCTPEEGPDCEGDCGKKDDPGCEGYDCEPGKKDHKLICHVMDEKKDKLKGALIYLAENEANEHLNDHDPDYEVSDLDKNPDNDSEDCLGIDICKYKQLHGSAPEEEVSQCNTEEILTLTEMSLFHPAPDECITCTLFVPAKPTNEFCAANYPLNLDSDNDGLSDRTECYLNTKSNEVDSDNDSCWDGDEVNLFGTNPLVQTDCALSEMLYESVVITDPKNNWTVKSLDISGLTPKTTLDVGITAFPASHKLLSPIVDAFDELVATLQQIIDPNDVVAQEKRNSELTTLANEVKAKIQTFYKFAEEQSDINYEKEKAILKTIESYVAKTPQEIQAEFSQAEALKRSLQTIKTGGVFLGLVTEFNEIAVGDDIGFNFNLVPRVALEDGLYDLVAVARLKNKTLTSEPVRIALDSTAEVNTPRPESLDGVQLDPNVIKQGWELTSENTLSNIEVKTKNGRPVISGQSTYGAQIFAKWQSLTLSSSIIVDSSEGTFEIQAPRELEKDEDHKVTLYAVVDTEKGEVRSDTVTIDFHVEGTNYLIWILLGLILLIAAGLVARHRMKKIDALPPEHRAKENELYHAFGEKDRPAPLPEHHKEKEAEVNDVFGKN